MNGGKIAEGQDCLVFEDVLKDPSLKQYFDAAVQAVWDNAARVAETRAMPGYPLRKYIRAMGKAIIFQDILEYYLYSQRLASFSFDRARDFADMMRKLVGQRQQDYTMNFVETVTKIKSVLSRMNGGNMTEVRDYLIFEDVLKDPSLKQCFDAAVQAVLDNTARIGRTRAKQGYSQRKCIRALGKEIIFEDILEYYLYSQRLAGFSFERARNFAELMRKLVGRPDYTLNFVLCKWAENYIRDPYFFNKSRHKFSPEWELKPDVVNDFLTEDYFKFACYIAVCHIKYGASYDFITTNEIFGFVTALGSDLPAKMKKQGSGAMGKELTEYKNPNLSCKANDAFATVKITMKEESKENYGRILDFLCALLKADFPRSYSIDFRSAEKSILPIKGLPKCGVHHLFANALKYMDLHEKIEQYAQLAMKEFEWYTNLENENCAMPGTFAVFSLAILDERHHSLICKYLRICDGEHQALQGKFVLAYIEKFGFTEKGLELYDLCEKNIQQLPPRLEALYQNRK